MALSTKDSWKLVLFTPGLRSENKEKFLSVWINTYIFLDYLEV